MKFSDCLAKMMFVVVLSCGFLFANEPPPPKDMILSTPDGMKIVLHGDNTWTFQDAKKTEIEKDFTVPVSNGKIVLIGSDGTWGYVEKEIKDEEKLIKTDSIVANGHSLNRDVMAATADAQKQAMTQATTKMKNALRQLDIDQKKLDDCMKRVEKDVNKKEDFKEGKGWDVSVRMVLDRGSILAVAECAKKSESDTTAAQKKKSKKK